MNDDIKTNVDYRRILATASKLEAIQSNLESVIDFFLAPIVKLYYKLCNDCLKLFFEGEFKLDHFRKAEELVWRRIYHDIYRFQKTKNRVKERDEHLIESHFVSGIGFYSSLIVNLRTHYKINDVAGVIVPLNLTLGPLDNFADNRRLNEECYDIAIGDESSISSSNNNCSTQQSTAREWAKQAIYRSLVYMGDLARYLLEVSQFNYRKLAFEFYKSASRNQANHGLPFNQLATLAGSSNHNLDAVCNYMRCCLRPKPFEGSEGNMKKIFELNRKFFEDLSKTKAMFKISEVLSSTEPSSAAELMLKTIIVTFIKLTSDLWTVISNEHIIDLMKNEIITETRVFFETLREALELERNVPFIACNSDHKFCPISGGLNYDEEPKYVTSTIMYEFCSISLMLIAKYQKHLLGQEVGLANETKSIYVKDLISTLALNLLHYSTSRCQRMVMHKIQELRVNRQELNVYEKVTPNRMSSLSSKFQSENLSSSTLNSNTDSNSRRFLSRLRQRKAATNYSDSVNRQKHVALHNEDFDMSELEETALSTIDALEISSDMSEEPDYTINDLINLDSSGDEESRERCKTAPFSGSFNNIGKPVLRPTRSQNYKLEKSLNSESAPNSLPVPDLLTGDISERMNFRVSASSQSPINSPNGPIVSESRSSPNALDKENMNHCNELESVMAYIYTHTHLPTIKILCDWLLSSSEIISSNLESFRSFCEELGDLVVLLNDLKLLASIKGSNISSNTIHLDSSSSINNHHEQCDENFILKHIYTGPSWVQKYPLSCDYPLIDLSPLRSVHKLNIDFDNQVELSDTEAGALTVQCIVAFHCALVAFLDNKDNL